MGDQWSERKSDSRAADGQSYARASPLSILYHALIPADGRPLAVTMAKADPLTELKILLHPTLVDTALGHRVIEIVASSIIHLPGCRAQRGAREGTESIFAQSLLYRMRGPHVCWSCCPAADFKKRPAIAVRSTQCSTIKT